MCLIAPLNSYRCVCPPGFTLAANGMTCLINDNFPMLLVNDDDSIYRIQPEVVGRTAVTELPTTHIDSIGRLAYDWNSKTLFITDLKKPAIYEINMTTLMRRELVVNHLVNPGGLAFDSSSKTLYWVDSSKGTVEVISTITSASSELIVDLSKPTDIVLVQNIGKMFISTIGEYPSVTMYDMDGKNANVLNMIIATPVALAVHPTASILYWADPRAEIISAIDYLDPRSESTILKSRVENIMSIAVNEKYLYWTDSKHNVLNLLKFNTTHSHTISLPNIKSGPVSRKVIYTAPPVAKRSLGETCANNNGGCSHLCLASPSGRSCTCAPGMKLQKDGTTCKEKVCTSDEFRCLGNSKKCVPKEFQCDGVKDCDDGSDEKCESKEPQRCPGNDFRCLNGRCILASWKCDKRDDCGDNSDEIGCPAPVNCSHDQFTCAKGECIPSLWRCDGENDCVDNSDEANCHATACNEETQLRCDHGQCIPKSWACDGAPDCFDNTDERNCLRTEIEHDTKGKTIGECEKCLVPFEGGRDIEASTSKPKTCKDKEFKCGDGPCIDEKLVCDKRADCEDGSDERNCSRTNTTCDGDGYFTCNDGLCIYIHEVCDGYKDCAGGEEEINCKIMNSVGSKVLSVILICDFLDIKQAKLSTKLDTATVASVFGDLSTVWWLLEKSNITIYDVSGFFEKALGGTEKPYIYRLWWSSPKAPFPVGNEGRLNGQAVSRGAVSQAGHPSADIPREVDLTSLYYSDSKSDQRSSHSIRRIQTRTADQCSFEEYFCANNSRCISKRWICDGDNDCGDAEDENPENCTKRVKPTLPPHKKSIFFIPV
ncbi:low-density lipoprotein receptor-related protein 1B [Trichonephila clavipes]|nr:low-density lipoprotein receptor-related protein 1B [Trichonephila clavipes]